MSKLLFTLFFAFSFYAVAVLAVDSAFSTADIPLSDEGHVGGSYNVTDASANIFFGYEVSGSNALAYLNGATFVVTLTDFDGQTTEKYSGPFSNSESLYFPPCDGDQAGTWSYTVIFANNTEAPPQDGLVNVYYSYTSSDLAADDSFPYISPYFQFFFPIDADTDNVMFNITGEPDIGQMISQVAIFDSCVSNPTAGDVTAVESVAVANTDTFVSIQADVAPSATYYLLLTSRVNDLSELSTNKRISTFEVWSSSGSSVQDDDSGGNGLTYLYVAVGVGFAICVLTLIGLVVAFFVVKKKKESQVADFDINGDDYDSVF